MPKAPLGLLLLLLMLAASLAGCANFTAVSSGMPAQQVQAKLGAPETVRKNADGSEVWEYPGGPLGRQTYMVTLGSDHAVREVHQVLNDEYFSRVRAGMSRDEVRRLLGRPGEIMVFGARDEEVWSWRYREWGVRNMELYVQFDRSTGTLKSISRFQIDTSDGKRK
ncbi:MAG: outer membrane protein assembly factor BamE [Betaproteobacteria bacterium]|nr:MAG: outer membrane protein assembly factor BamE [Betaproteobacteria bacterium]